MPRFVISAKKGIAIAGVVALAACAGVNPQPMPISVYHISFSSDSFSIDGAGQRTIYAVADATRSNKTASVTIVGRADPTGSPAYNMQLSKKRAIAVHDALINSGQVAPDQIETAWTSEWLAAAGTAGTNPPRGSRVVDIFVH